MIALTQNQKNELNAIATKDSSLWSVRDAVRYYEILKQGGSVYAERCLSVVVEGDRSNPKYAEYSSVQGQLANKYSYYVAKDEGIDFSTAGSNWTKMQQDLIKQDWNDRKPDPSIELTRREIDDNHQAAFERVGLPREAFTTDIPLSQIAEYDPARADAVWAEAASGRGFWEMVKDGLTVALNNGVSMNQTPSEIYQDYKQQVQWIKHITQAIAAVGVENVKAMMPEADFQKFWDNYNFLKNLLDHNGLDTTGRLDDPADPQAPNACPLTDWAKEAMSHYGAAEAIVSPLVLDLNGDGIRLAASTGAGSVYFDMDNDGRAEATAWAANGDGLLALDRNGNGVIDNQNELFGNTSAFANGFANLKSLDTNGDNQITAADAQFANLRVWVDADSDGVTDAGELKTLSSLGITSIGTAYTNVNITVGDSVIKQRGSFTMNGLTRQVGDAWFKYDDVNTEDTRAYTLDIRTLFLPTLRGYGNLSDLHIAMSNSETLLQKVQAFVTAGYGFGTIDSPQAQAALKSILWEWAGASGIDPASRGADMDARDVAFLETFMGKTFRNQPGGLIYPAQADELKETMATIMDNMSARLMYQNGGDALIHGIHYNSVTDMFEGTPSIDVPVFSGEVTHFAATDENRALTAIEIFKFIDDTVGVEALSVADQAALDTAIHTHLSAFGMTYDMLATMQAGTPADDIVTGNDNANLLLGGDGSDDMSGMGGNDLAFGGDGIDFIYGDGGNDVLYGDGDEDYLYGDIGNDTLYGGAGDDTLEGEDGDDILNGGQGIDQLDGGDGNDTYIFARGDSLAANGGETFVEYVGYGTDTIKFTGGILPTDVRMWVDVFGQLNIQYSPTDTLCTYGIEAGTGYTRPYSIEKITFDNGTIWDLKAGNVLMNDTDAGHEIYGTANADNIDGRGGADYIIGDAGNDTIQGGDGNDTVYGGIGNDILRGGNGNDQIQGEDGDDTIDGGAGDDKLYGQAGIDTLNYASSTAAITVSLAVTTAQVTGGAGKDTVSGFENLTGGAYNDKLTGSTGNNILHGAAGNDTLDGGKGNDTLYGDGGADILTGGAGADRFVFDKTLSGVDTIKDFSKTEDLLDLSKLLTAFDPVTDAITKFVQITNSGANSIIKVDLDGAGTAHGWTQVATLTGVTGLTDEQALMNSGHLIA